MGKRPRQFKDFRRTRRRTLALTSELSQGQLDFRPAPRQWSVGEVLDHLIRVDRIFRPEMDELVARKRRGRPAFLIRTLADFGYSLPAVPRPVQDLLNIPLVAFGIVVPRPVRQAIARLRRVPAKSPRIIAPQRGRAAGDLHDELRDMLENVESLYRDNRGLAWDQLYYFNPLAGFTTLLGILAFTASHESRHQDQIHDVLAHRGFPRGAA